MPKSSNRLAAETSPYLQQHAHNPVDWFPWGDEALEKARREDKPILVSIGYSACHWCHVMERESFEDAEVAAIMNENFVNIKIDREERPDLDHIYMDALQAMTGSGGWPLNVFLTPEAKPFFGGTYFPPQRMMDRPSWKETLASLVRTYREKRQEVEEQATRLLQYLSESNQVAFRDKLKVDIQTGLSPDGGSIVFSQLLNSADKEWGGFGKAPKFPQTFCISYLLHYYFHEKDEAALKQACLSLDKMVMGGIFDQLGGGFARYATDSRWIVPHFEKMLYDNALLLITLSEAYQLTQRDVYKTAIEKTLDFILKEWLTPEGGFYSALDADSEGEEGKYYTWTWDEIQEILGEQADLFCAFYHVVPEGNWEGRSILHQQLWEEEFARDEKLEPENFVRELAKCRKKLLEVRQKRVRPQLDDKVLLGWNALMILALCKAYAALGHDHYRGVAEHSLAFINKAFRDGSSWFHTYKDGKARIPAFLDDLAFLIQALIQLQEVTGKQGYLDEAKELMEFVIEEFGVPEGDLFYYTSRSQADVILRKIEIYDGATPSGNAVMALNMHMLGVLFDRGAWRNQSYNMIKKMEIIIQKYPSSFGYWAIVMQGLIRGIPEIALVGQNFNQMLKNFLCIFIPLKIIQSSDRSFKEYPLLNGKTASIGPQFYVCKNFTCQQPVNQVDDLMKQLMYQ